MKALGTKTIIIHLLSIDRKTYLSTKRLQKLLIFIYSELSKRNILENYEINFDIGYDAIEKSILCNSQIFDIDTNGDLIYLRKRNIDDLAKQYVLGENLKEIIASFAKSNTG